ncbi:membrane protein insertase YidC [Pseudoalteromonas sp. SSM20]|uniref:membrane protein insertase YidC n=1 Tax=Pseudoalteromonas sp. SSM20 TaxID=3139394 RepID=UPI003BAD1521
MESQRTFLFIGFLLVSFLLFQQWNMDNNPQVNTETSATTQSSTNQSTDNDFVPQSSTGDLPVASVANSRQIVEVTTDVFSVKLDTFGGDIIETKLLKFKEKIDSDEPFMLLGVLDGNQYFSQSGLIGLHGPDASAEGRPTYQAAQTSYQLEGDELRVPLTFVKDGVSFTKTYIFKAGRYDVDVEYQIANNTAETKQVQLFTQIKRSITEKGGMIDQTYLGTAYGTTEEPYEKYSFDDIKERDLNINTTAGYISFIQHYFVSAWVPKQDQQNNIYTKARNDNSIIIGLKGPLENVAANSAQTITSTYYMGPKDSATLEALQEDLDLTVDYGLFWFISQPLHSLLMWLYGLIGSLGLAIIAITLIVKMVLYPLTKAQYTSMAKMRNLQPKIMALKDRYGDDRQKMGQAMMEMYRKEKVNPMGGCFPLLLQMPIFLGLFYVFMESVEIRHTEFLYLNDLAAMDPYFILPILFGASMFLMQKLQPMTVTDPMQQKMMTWMPVMFSVFFIWFPSGLVMYWLVSNLISIAQMLYIYKGMEKKGISVKS